MKRKRIGSDHSFKLLARFLCLLSYSQGMFEYPKKPRFPSKPGPTLKRPINPWWLCTLSLTWWKWLAKLIYDISVIGIEMKHLPMWDLYTFERFLSIWMNPLFSLMFFRNKMQNDLNLIFGSVNSTFVLSFLIVAFSKMLF